MSLDQFLSRIQLLCYERKGCLLSVFFHHLFLDQAEAQCDAVDPQQGTTVGHLRHLIEHFLKAGYRFASPPELLNGLDPGQRHVLLTFDDGYCNNHRALPLLREYGVRALFFVSASHVKCGKAFWWDVLYRARRAQGRLTADIWRESAQLNVLQTEQIESRLMAQAGPCDFKPVGDVDRPFTPEELREFAQDEHVFIGNHTSHHAVLGAYPAEAVRSEIAEAQVLLEEMTGRRPLAIAYPNGVHTPEIARLAREAGLRLGFTTEPRKDFLPEALQGESAMLLGRFCPEGNERFSRQCDAFRADLKLSARFEQFKQVVKRALRGRQPD
jgi:peptidoglycan/xylan/chitin deacetylase (PgdA/CDA1 family)